jgi:EAL and modified HD-GYP domain-containing signal transduction protein
MGVDIGRAYAEQRFAGVVDMNDVFVARQPIFDRRLEVVGYELLFRAQDATTALVADAEGATATVVLNSFTEIGLERMVGSRPAWINVSRDFVLHGFARSVPPELVLLEILEDQLIDDELVAAITALKHQGHRFALDDFHYAPSAEPLLRLVDVVKLDLLELGREEFSGEVARLQPYGVTLLAEKLETQDDFAYSLHAGCELFQGYFFCRPELVHGRRVDANRMSLLRLLAALQDPTIELPDLERTIALDVGLSYRLLRYINSAFFGLRQEVRSVGQALALLGVDKLKQWAALSIFASVEAKPAELTLTALIRARFCESAIAYAPGANARELFTLGLFSVIDALMDTSMTEVLASIPFPQDMRDALITHEGPKGRLLDCVTALERADFEHAQAIISDAGELYLSALTWADRAAEAVFVQPATG